MRYDERSISEVRQALCGHYPEPLRGETLYGACARFHHLAANRRPALTGAVLFGDERASRRHCVPQGLTTLCDTLGELLGSPSEVLRRTTHAALYFRFMTSSGRHEATVGSCGPVGMRRQYQFGWASQRFDLQHPLRLCPSCVQDDTNQHGIPTWHLRHQLPGTLFCQVHRQPLAHVVARDAKSSRWLTPNNCITEVPVELARIGSTQRAFLLTLARVCEALLEDSALNLVELRRWIRATLADLGVVQAHRAINADQLQRWVDRHFCSMAAAGFPSFNQSAWARDLINGVSGNHPLRWAVLFACMASEGMDVEKMIRTAHEAQSETLPGFAPITQFRAPPVAYEVLGQDVSLKDAASAAGVGRATVTRWLTDANLRARWTEARNAALFSRHAATLASVLASGGITRIAARRAAPAAYQWMRRNRPDWLEIHLLPLDSRFDPQLRLWK